MLQVERLIKKKKLLEAVNTEESTMNFSFSKNLLAHVEKNWSRTVLWGIYIKKKDVDEIVLLFGIIMRKDLINFFFVYNKPKK